MVPPVAVVAGRSRTASVLEPGDVLDDVAAHLVAIARVVEHVLPEAQPTGGATRRQPELGSGRVSRGLDADIRLEDAGGGTVAFGSVASKAYQWSVSLDGLSSCA
jgi:hypothetical protein